MSEPKGLYKALEGLCMGYGENMANQKTWGLQIHFYLTYNGKDQKLRRNIKIHGVTNRYLFSLVDKSSFLGVSGSKMSIIF